MATLRSNTQKVLTKKKNTQKVEEHIKSQNVKRGLERLDRRSGTGMIGSPKKGGHGGKYTWAGTRLRDHHEVEPGLTALDKKDPNYVEDDEEHDQIGGAGKSSDNAGEISSGSKA